METGRTGNDDKLFNNIANLKRMALSSEKEDITIATCTIKQKYIKPPKFNINVEYPKIKENDRGFNNLVRNLVEAEIHNFKEFVLNEEEFISKSGTDSYCELGYEALNKKDDIISVRLWEQNYFGGYPHPNNTIYSLNYNLKTGKEITLQSLFKKDTEYLETLSRECVKDLMRQSEGTFNEEGLSRDLLAPRAENFRTFNISPDGLQIALADAPYSLGTPVATIPYEQLKSFIDPEGPLRKHLDDIRKIE